MHPLGSIWRGATPDREVAMRYLGSPFLTLSLFALSFLILASQANAGERKWGEEEQAEVESRTLWSLELNGYVLGLSFGPDGLVIADQWGKVRYIVDGGTGTVLWKGPMSTTVPIAGKPHPVIVETGESSYAIRAVVRGSKTTWHDALSGVFLLGTAYPAHGLLLALSVDQIGADTTKPTVRAFSLTSGKLLWTATLAPMQAGGDVAEWSLGFGPSVTRSTLILFLNDHVYGLSLGTGKEIWRHRTEFDFPKKGEIPLWQAHYWRVRYWQALGDDSLLASRCRLMRMSPTKGMVWNEQLGPDCAYVHGIDIDEGAVAAGFAGTEGQISRGATRSWSWMRRPENRAGERPSRAGAV
jgi:hypothetical protein